MILVGAIRAVPLRMSVLVGHAEPVAQAAIGARSLLQRFCGPILACPFQ